MNGSHVAWIVAIIIGASTNPAWSQGNSPGERLAEIEAAQKAARERFTREIQEAKQNEAARGSATDRFLRELDKNAGAAISLARANPDDPIAFEALKFTIRTNGSGPGDWSARALRMLLDHADWMRPGQEDYLAHVALRLWQYADAEVLLRRVLDRNPSRVDRAAACYWLARYLAQQAQMVRRLRDKRGEQKLFENYSAAIPIGKFVSEKDPEALDRDSERLLERIIAEFGDVKLADYERNLAEVATHELFSSRHLRIGKTTPEIEGKDHEGRTFKLSETRGKVVLLTFSGEWCGPCVSMYPQQRELLAKHKDKPFAIVSVSTDRKIETLRGAINAGKITWRCWWDGGTEGPITSQWGIKGFPSIFVLDRRGVIRFKNARGEDLDRAIITLLDEME